MALASSLAACAGDDGASASDGTSSSSSSGGSSSSSGATASSSSGGSSSGTTSSSSGDADAGQHGGDKEPSEAKLAISGATYEDSTAKSGGYVYSVEFSIDNTSNDDVTSLETMTIDFGGGDSVSLTKPVCSGSYAIEAGDSRSVEMQIVIGESGSLSTFAFICPGKQTFGGASGKAPASASFTSPISISVGGKTTAGTYTATGSASPSS